MDEEHPCAQWVNKAQSLKKNKQKFSIEQNIASIRKTLRFTLEQRAKEMKKNHSQPVTVLYQDITILNTEVHMEELLYETFCVKSKSLQN